MDLAYDLVSPDEIHDAIAIEQEGFPPDEAATLEAFQFRQQRAPDLFFGVFIPQANGRRKLTGYICSTLSSSEILTHDSMFTHVDGAPTVCIHAICIEKQSRRKGIATQLLKQYITRLRARAEAGSVPYERIVLIAHDNLIPFYEKAGFRNLGKSQVVHGSLPWYQLSLDLNNTSTNTTISAATPTSLTAPQTVVPSEPQSQPIPDGLLDALSRNPSSRNRRSGKPLSSFENGLDDVVVAAASGESLNRFDLLCPRPGCGSIILKREIAQCLQRASEALQPPEVPQNPLLESIPPGQTEHWWLIEPSAMVFENIGISKAVDGIGSRKKLLACAECDLGPLGWCEEGGTKFWLACSRVGYRTS